MITESQIYWITRMDYVQGFALAISIACTVLSGVWLTASAICHSVNHHGAAEGYSSNKELLPVSRKSLKWSILVSLLAIILVAGACLIPTTKETCAIKTIPVIANNRQVQELPNKVVELANEWIEELKPNKESE